MDNKKIVCLGGGIGTVNLIKGLKNYFNNITVVVSMADDGGSSGRLRRLYNAPPPGDLVSCMAALVDDSNPFLFKLLTYRFRGDRYGKDADLGGQKLGNLIMVAANEITKDFQHAIEIFKETFSIKGTFLPATLKATSISATTIEGKRIFREETIDMGRYAGKRILRKVFLSPKNASVNPKVIEAIEKADVVIAGPGDLYTTILPILIVKGIKEALQKTTALRIFILNVTNKPFETKGYKLEDYIGAIKRHLKFFPFDKIIANSNSSPKIPKRYHYRYVGFGKKNYEETNLIKADVVDETFPLYHNSLKLAKTIVRNI